MANVIYPRSKEEVDRICEVIDRVSKEVSKTKESARAFLIKGGFITKDGKRLSKRYR